MPYKETNEGDKKVKYFALGLHAGQVGDGDDRRTVLMLDTDDERKTSVIFSFSEVQRIYAVTKQMLELFDEHGPNAKGRQHFEGVSPSGHRHEKAEGSFDNSLKSIALTKEEWKQIFLLLKCLEPQAVKENDAAWAFTERARRNMAKVGFGANP